MESTITQQKRFAALNHSQNLMSKLTFNPISLGLKSIHDSHLLVSDSLQHHLQVMLLNIAILSQRVYLCAFYLKIQKSEQLLQYCNNELNPVNIFCKVFVL